MTAPHSTSFVEVRNLTKQFPVKGAGKGARVHAVDDVSFTIAEGETLGLVGESGSGKSTTGRSILRLIEPTSGQVFLDGQEVTRMGAGPLRRARRDMQMIFQDPYGSLDPTMTVAAIVGEGIEIHGLARDRSERDSKVVELLETVGLGAQHLDRFAHEFSGGQRQRIGIARALAVGARFVVADEPVSALDVSVQAQVINLLDELQKRLGLTYLFIAHDLSVVEHISRRVAVMYLGRIVEIAPVADLYSRPRHPYTEALLSAVPVTDPNAKRTRITLEGDAPSPLQPPSGCRFHTRCRMRVPECSSQEQTLKQVTVDHWVACHLRD